MTTPEVRLHPTGDAFPPGELGQIARLWWLLLLAGLASLIIGILLLAWPTRTLEVIAILVGINLLLAGALQIGLAFGERAGSRSVALLGGALAGIAGLIVIRHPGGSVLVVALAVGIYLVVAGVVKLVGALEASAGRGWLLAEALLDLAIGVLIVAWPSFGVSSLGILLGIALIVRGAVQCAVALALRSAARQLPA